MSCYETSEGEAALMIRSGSVPSIRLAATERTSTPGIDATAPTIVFLHGVGCERGQFIRQMNTFDTSFRLLSLDLPGHGDSPEFSDHEYSLESMTRAVVQEVQVRNLSNIVLVGHSAGGIIALKAGIEHPSSVKAVILVDTNIALSDAAKVANREKAEKAETGRWRERFLASMEDAWGPDDASCGKQSALHESVFKSLATTPEYVIRPLWREILALDTEPLWRQCQIPTLLLRGRRNVDLRFLRSLNPNITAIDMGKVCNRHWIHLLCPELFNDTVYQFVKDLPVPRMEVEPS